MTFMLLGFLSVYAQEDQDVLTFKMMKESGEYYKQGEEFYKVRKFDKAGDAFAKSFEILGTNKEAAYNAACAYSLAGDKANALKYCEKALRTGMFDFEGNPDFFNIKGTDEFQDIVYRAKIMKEAVANQSIDPTFILPEGYSKAKKYPLLVAFHGFNSNPKNFSNIYKKVARENQCILMMCCGSKIIKQGSFAWQFEEDEYNRVIDDIDMAKLRYSVDPTKVILTGFSQGGFMVYALGMVQSQNIAGLIPVGGLMPQNLSMKLVRNKGMKVYSIIGDKDSPKVIKNNEGAKTSFSQNGNPFKLDRYDMGHEYPANKDAVLTRAIQWILN